MSGSSLPYKVGVPPKAAYALWAQGVLGDDVTKLGWSAHPKLGDPYEGAKRSQLDRVVRIDAEEQVAPFLNDKRLIGTIPTMDVFDGCFNQCSTCLFDSPLPTKMYTYDSLERFFGNPRAVAMLHRRSLRMGSTSDLLTHPRGFEIAAMILKKTSPDQLKSIKVLINYRRRTEEQLDQLLQLAGANQGRLEVCISLPYNFSDVQNLAFQEYVRSRPQFFDVDKLNVLENGMFDFDNEAGSGIIVKNVDVFDVRNSDALHYLGRVLPADAIRNLRVHRIDPEKNEAAYRSRGLVKVYLNPAAVWLHAYATTFESHTSRVFTPITQEKLPILSALQFHPHYDSPPHWPGGTGTLGKKVLVTEINPKPVVVAEK